MRWLLDCAGMRTLQEHPGVDTVVPARGPHVARGSRSGRTSASSGVLRQRGRRAVGSSGAAATGAVPAAAVTVRSAASSVVPWGAPRVTRRRAAIGMALLAAGIHALVAPGHLRESWLYGTFFLTVAAGQALLGWLLTRRQVAVPVVLAAVWGTVALMGLYVVSRTVGLPLGPSHHHGIVAHAGAHLQHVQVAGDFGYGGPVIPPEGLPSNVEAVGALDLTSLAAELALVVLLVGFLPAGHRRWTTNALVGVGALGLVARATGWLG